MSRETRAAPGPRVGAMRPPADELGGRGGRCPGLPPGLDLRPVSRVGETHRHGRVFAGGVVGWHPPYGSLVQARIR